MTLWNSIHRLYHCRLIRFLGSREDKARGCQNTPKCLLVLSQPGEYWKWGEETILAPAFLTGLWLIWGYSEWSIWERSELIKVQHGCARGNTEGGRHPLQTSLWHLHGACCATSLQLKKRNPSWPILGKEHFFCSATKASCFPSFFSCHTCQDELQLHSVWNSHPVNVLGVKVFYYIFNWRDKQVWRQKIGEMLWHSQEQLPLR